MPHLRAMFSALRWESVHLRLLLFPRVVHSSPLGGQPDEPGTPGLRTITAFPPPESG